MHFMTLPQKQNLFFKCETKSTEGKQSLLFICRVKQGKRDRREKIQYLANSKIQECHFIDNIITLEKYVQ